jgi:hypothetical protein
VGHHPHILQHFLQHILQQILQHILHYTVIVFRPGRKVRLGRVMEREEGRERREERGGRRERIEGGGSEEREEKRDTSAQTSAL